MERSTISSPHGIKLIPVSSIFRFGQCGYRVYLLDFGSPLPAVREIPGTLKVGSSALEGSVQKTISFELADVSAPVAALLAACRGTFLVALYTDERGNRRVAGSPDYPLTLDYTDAGGSFTVTLTGIDTDPDAFLEG